LLNHCPKILLRYAVVIALQFDLVTKLTN